MFYINPDNFKQVNGTVSIPVPNTSTVYSKAHKIAAGSVFGLSVALASTNGTPSVKFELQVSDTAPAALEGVNDSVGLDWCTQEGGAPIITVSDKTLHKITINPTPAVYMRLKMTGQATNQSDTVVTAKAIVQQQLGARG